MWFRRDLRAFDHAALHHALKSSKSVYCAFIFDSDILAGLPPADRRVHFIHASVAELDCQLRQLGGALLVRHGPAVDTIVALAGQLQVDAVFTTNDYEPLAIARDAQVGARLQAAGRRFASFKDQVIFEKDEVLSLAGRPFSVFTPYRNAWRKRLDQDPGCLAQWPTEPHAAALAAPLAGETLPSLDALGFGAAALLPLPVAAGMSGAAALFDDFTGRVAAYREARDYPAIKGPSYLSMHLRFGTLSVRYLVRAALALMASGAGGEGASVWLSELIWREFYAMRWRS